MFRMRVVQAEFGDCFLLEYGSAVAPRFLLVDGGPPDTWELHLESELAGIAQVGGALDLVMLSHVDNDHIVGLLDLLARLRADGAAPLIGVGGIWHNSFGRTVDVDGTLGPRLRAATMNAASVQSAVAVNGIAEGNALRLAAQALGIPLNAGFPGDLVCADDHPQPVLLGNLKLTVVGPTRANLDELRAQWETWLAAHEDAVADGDPQVMANSDRSVPNLSSIVVLAEADGKRVLCTGDGRSDHLLQGLGQAGLLDAGGAVHVDVLKVAHHGSDRNATRKFFRLVTADTYVLSANGKDDNPDLATLIWIVEEAGKQGRQIELFATNDTPSLRELVAERDPAVNGYTLTVMDPGVHSTTIVLAD
ncbi:MAG: metallo-beta-lactamase family protein [Acidobacteria bacterium]|nr:metallo-beta-lactamase family protein [Acidobacteriota bacterium]